MLKNLFKGPVECTAEDEAFAASYDESKSVFQPVNPEPDSKIDAFFEQLHQEKNQRQSQSQAQLDVVKQQIEQLPPYRQAELEEWLKARHADNNNVTRPATPVAPVK